MTSRLDKWITLLAMLLLPIVAWGQYSVKSYGEMGIKLNTRIYCLAADPSRGFINANSTQLVRGTVTGNTSDPNQQFAFVTISDNDTAYVYLYNIGQKKFAHFTGGNRSAMTLVTGSSNPSPIYVYNTDNATYNLAFSFKSNTDWGTTNKTDGNTVNISGGSLVVLTNYSKFDEGNRWRATEASTPGFTASQLEEARNNLKEGWLKGDFHSKGHSGRDLMANGMGDVAEVHYYYYVNKDQGSDDNVPNNSSIKSRNGIVLQLPFYDYYNDPDNGNRNGNNMEPNAYFRWFDYNTDGMPVKTETINNTTYQRITPWTPGNVKKVYDKNGKDLGLFYYNNSTNINPNCQNVGVIYNIPDSAQYSDWKGDVIGCDVSRYYDYNDSSTPDKTTFTHEPTLSVRYVFHILPAKKLADDMEASLIRAKSDSLTLQDHALLVFGARGDSATINLRTQFSRLKDYWFYPYTGKGNVYHTSGDTTHVFTSGGFTSTTPLRATGTEWRVYTSDSTKYRVFATTSSGYGNRPSGGNKRLQDRDLDISLNREVGSGNSTASDGISGGMRIHALNGSDWKDLDGNPVDPAKININDECFIVGYVTNGNNKCPFFNARLEINHLYPMSDAQISQRGLTERTTRYLDNQYGSPVALFSFDNENTGQNLNAPDGLTARNNFDLIPSPFAQRQYGFVYYDLAPWTENLGRGVGSRAPLHGDYEMVKSMNVSLANKRSVTLYDRTHAADNSQFGYFFYTDASQESRMIGYQDFDGTLCPGSQIAISAYVASTNAGNTQSQPELRFSLYGIVKDADDNVTSEKLFATICSGNFRNNIDGYSSYNTFDAGTWYQVFGAVTLPNGVGIDNYSSFRITIDNYCNDTNGADYAIDDIRVYQNNSKLTVIQIPALCAGETSDQVAIKIKGNHQVLKEISGAETEDAKVYFRFVRSNGTVVTGENFYGANHNSYGEATVPSTYDASAKINGQNRFETNAAGQREVVLVYQGFNLRQDSTYYVSLNYRDPSNENYWGKQNVICSMYSNNFQLVRQNIVINNTENGAATVSVDCGKDTTTSYRPIQVGITAPDKVNGGKTVLTNVHYDWFNGTLAQYKAVKAEGNDSTLSGAITHYRAAYPTGAYNPSNGPKTADNGMVYSQEEKDLIESHLWSTSHTSGDLWMSGETSLSQAPLSAGRDTIIAIPIEDYVTVSDTITYEVCTDPMEISIRGLSDGPGLTFGMSNINYPLSEPYRSVRLGLPQIRKMGSNGVLRIPIKSRQWQGDNESEALRFVDTDGNPSVDIYLANTNDPTLYGQTVKIAEVQRTDLPSDDNVVNLCKIDTSKLHEGYWYELSFRFLRTDLTGVDLTATQCAGETFLILKIVPEYLTWTPTADNGLNANWNNDENWTRSTAGELFDATYKDYRTPTYRFRLYSDNDTYTHKYNSVVDTSLAGTIQPSSYVPMYFSKVIIPTETNLPYPMLGYIRRQEGTRLIQSMTNEQSNAPTTNIQYDMEAAPYNTDSTSYACAVFDGNLCEQIYFKMAAQLRQEQYLLYKKAFVEMALPVNEWGAFTSPMNITFGGDMYVPKQTAMQTTPLFKPINFEDIDQVDENGIPSSTGRYGLFGKSGSTMYSRIKMPTYQKIWGNGGNEYNESLDNESSYDNPYTMLIYPSVDNGDNIDLQANERYNSMRNVWSHTFNALGNISGSDDRNKFNKLAGRYADGVGVAGKIGDDYTTDDNWIEAHKLQPSDTIAWALMRLPKDDRTFSYRQLSNGQETDGSTRSKDLQVPYRNDSYRLGIDYDPSEGSLGADTIKATELAVSPEGILKYVLIGNPYTSTISARAFINANSSILEMVKRPTEEGSTDSTEVHRIWTLNHNVLYEIDPMLESSTISPGQAFFVKMKVPGRDDVLFTARMQTDPTISRSTAVTALAGAKAYYVTDMEDIADVIEHGRITRSFRCWSPEDGYVAIDRGSFDGSWAAQIYTLDGRLVTAVKSGSDSSRSIFTGRGLFIVRINKSGAATETFKVAVK